MGERKNPLFQKVEGDRIPICARKVAFALASTVGLLFPLSSCQKEISAEDCREILMEKMQITKEQFEEASTAIPLFEVDQILQLRDRAMRELHEFGVQPNDPSAIATNYCEHATAEEKANAQHELQTLRDGRPFGIDVHRWDKTETKE